ncbi:MAG: hypothetical protein ACLTDX_08775 [[Clostridium] innocuum]
MNMLMQLQKLEIKSLQANLQMHLPLPVLQEIPITGSLLELPVVQVMNQANGNL